MTQLYKKAFGQDFDLGIEIPEYLEDISWKNDVCPSFSLKLMDSISIVLWVDFKNPEERELGDDLPRYTVQQNIDDKFDRILFETESPKAILNYLASEIKPNE